MIGHKNLKSLFQKTADRQRLENSIFYGEEKIGKRLFALCLANYLERGEFKESKNILSDLIFIDGHGQTLGIGIAVNLKNFLSQKPFFSSYRLAVINDAQFLTVEAQNALLKTAEESNNSARIILITRDAEFLLPTLVSRFQKFYFSPLKHEEMAEFAESNLGLTGEKAEEIIKKSFGQPGRAAELSDRKYNFADDLLRQPQSRREAFIKNMVADGNFEMNAFLSDLIAGLSLNTGKHYPLIKRTLKLSRNRGFNLNPRLQLDNLFSGILS